MLLKDIKWEELRKECIVCHTRTAIGMGTKKGFVCMPCFNNNRDLEENKRL